MVLTAGAVGREEEETGRFDRGPGRMAPGISRREVASTCAGGGHSLLRLRTTCVREAGDSRWLVAALEPDAAAASVKASSRLTGLAHG